MEQENKTSGSSQTENAHHVRLPGFILDDEIGLGDVLKRVTSRAGIRPCGPCQKRAEALNRRLVFSRRG